MVVKQRAIAVQDKEDRRNAILDAAEALFIEQPDRMASVSEVADAAGVAKGTVYLYFPSKEEMLLALHERHFGNFCRDLTHLLDGSAALDFDGIFEVARRHILRGPGYLPLASRCLGLMDREIPVERAIQFKVRVGEQLADAGGRLERHFPALAPGGGVALLCNSFGLMVGLWQLLNPHKRLGAAMERPELRMLNRDYETEAENSLRALWTGMLAEGARSSRRKRK